MPASPRLALGDEWRRNPLPIRTLQSTSRFTAGRRDSIRAVIARLGPALLLILAGCGTGALDTPRSTDRPSGSSPAGSQPADVRDRPTSELMDRRELAQRSLLLMLEDRRVRDAGATRPLLDASIEIRIALAETLGRIGDAASHPDLEFLLRDPEPRVRQAAAFGFGLLRAPESHAALLQATRDADRETAILAVEALGKQKAPLAEVIAAFGDLAERERLERLLPALFRFSDPEVLDWAGRGLALSDRRLHAGGAYALCRTPQAKALPKIRQLAKDPDPWVRGQAARALGLVGDGTDLAVLQALLDDASSGPVIHALRSAARLIGAGKAAPSAEWRRRILQLIDDPRPGVGTTALEVSSAWLLDATLGERLEAEARSTSSPSPRRAELALLALARARDSRVFGLVSEWSRSPDAGRRARAAEAAGSLDTPEGVSVGREILGRLAGDLNPAVRLAVLGARLQLAADEPGPIVRAALSDTDPVIRGAALESQVEHPQLETRELVSALERSRSDEVPDAALGAIRALQARGAAAVAESGTVTEVLTALARDDRRYLVRREAAQALAVLGPPGPGASPIPQIGAASRRDFEYYREVIERTRSTRWVDLRTPRGAIRLELDCPRAPMTCLNFLHLAAQGFYDGVAFHRVVPDFVAQAGDPRGDGTGGPGYEIRDEINRLRYEPGAVGMALSGPDTGGSQFFLMLTRAPHLDGGYTVFGRVVAGMEAAEQLEQGDRIERAVVRPLSE